VEIAVISDVSARRICCRLGELAKCPAAPYSERQKMGLNLRMAFLPGWCREYQHNIIGANYAVEFAAKRPGRETRMTLKPYCATKE
jgi:hypothetical protein